MTVNLTTLEGLARAGVAPKEIFIQAHNRIDELAMLNAEAARMRELGLSFKNTVKRYQGGIERGLPAGDRE